MAGLTRRGFLAKTSIGAMVAVPRLTNSTSAEAAQEFTLTGQELAGPVVAHVRNIKTGEIAELSPAGHPTERFHNQVHERRFNGRSVFAAVYPQVEAGDYDIWGDSPLPVDKVSIVRGEVATVDWHGRQVGLRISAPHHHD